MPTFDEHAKFAFGRIDHAQHEAAELKAIEALAKEIDEAIRDIEAHERLARIVEILAQRIEVQT